MAGSYDPVARKIELPSGDTMTIRVNVKNDGYDAVIFSIFNKKEGLDLLRLAAPIQDGQAVIRVSNQDTRDLEPGKYKWQLRFVSDPEYDDAGNIIANDDADDVVSMFGSEALPLPDFILRRDGAYV